MLANHSILDANMLWIIAWGLIATICDHEAKSFEEWNKYVGHINQLKDQLKKEFEKAHNDHTPPEGFEENYDYKAPVSRVPNGEGNYVVPKWVCFLEDERVVAYTFGAPNDSLSYMLNLYAEPQLDDETPFMPMPHWYCAALNVDETQFQTLYYKTAKREHWGHLTELKWHHDTARTVQDLQACISLMEANLEGACQAHKLSEFRLQATRAHELVEHTQGLINGGLHFNKHNRDAMHFLSTKKGTKCSQGWLED